jgi:hypothetical protein
MASEEFKLKRRWHDLAGQAAKETDPEKLMQIVKDLCGCWMRKRNRPPVLLRDRTNQKRPPASSVREVFLSKNSDSNFTRAK